MVDKDLQVLVKVLVKVSVKGLVKLTAKVSAKVLVKVLVHLVNKTKGKMCEQDDTLMLLASNGNSRQQERVSLNLTCYKGW